MREIRRATLIANAYAAGHAEAIDAAIAAAGSEVRVEVEEDEARRIGEAAERIPRAGGEPPDLCVVLGGDGSILRGLRRYADTHVPVFGVNFGSIGFLSTVERDELADGLRRAFSGDFTTLALPALEIEFDGRRHLAVNDVVFSRDPAAAVGELSYMIGGEEVGHVRCDGLVAATPAGSTGYNLANGGPVMAWGVEGYCVSFVAPHTLTARALVVAPDDVLHVRNDSSRDAVQITLDGVRVGSLDCGEEVAVSFRDGVSLLAQLPGTSFYQRIRERFGRLAQQPGGPAPPGTGP